MVTDMTCVQEYRRPRINSQLHFHYKLNAEHISSSMSRFDNSHRNVCVTREKKIPRRSSHMKLKELLPERKLYLSLVFFIAHFEHFF